MIAIGNSGDRSLIAAAQKGIEADSPLVRAMAVWAFGRLAAPTAVKATALRFAPEERDAAVLEEWKIALAVPAEA
jgi:epoxyqueuosine reductase